MEDQVPPGDRGRSFHLNARVLAFLVFVIGFLALQAALTRVSQGPDGPGILVGALIGAGVAALFGLAEWLTKPAAR